MKVVYERSFLKDLQKIDSRRTLQKVDNHITKIKAAKSIAEIDGVKKLLGHSSAYRIRFGAYRIGFFLKDGQIIFSRCLHRQDIYKRFPK